jgi:hypothetical protein
MSRGEKQEKRPEKSNTSSGKLVFKQDRKPGRIQLAHSQPHARQHCRPQHTSGALGRQHMLQQYTGGALGRRLMLQKTPLIAHVPRAPPYHTTVRALPYHTPLRSEQCHWQLLGAPYLFKRNLLTRHLFNRRLNLGPEPLDPIVDPLNLRGLERRHR